MNFESLMRYKALHQKYSSSNPQMVDHLLRQVEEAEKVGLKKLQFHVSPELFDQVENVCNYLEMSKREFLESVVQDAVKTAWRVINEEEAGPEDLGWTPVKGEGDKAC